MFILITNWQDHFVFIYWYCKLSIVENCEVMNVGKRDFKEFASNIYDGDVDMLKVGFLGDGICVLSFMSCHYLNKWFSYYAVYLNRQWFFGFWWTDTRMFKSHSKDDISEWYYKSRLTDVKDIDDVKERCTLISWKPILA